MLTFKSIINRQRRNFQMKKFNKQVIIYFFKKAQPVTGRKINKTGN